MISIVGNVFNEALRNGGIIIYKQRAYLNLMVFQIEDFLGYREQYKMIVI